MNVEAAGQDTAGRAPGAPPAPPRCARPPVAGLTVATLAAALAFAAVALRTHANFRTGSYDLVIFDQAVRGYAGWGAPVSPLKGVHSGFDERFSVLGDHVSPVLALWAPLYWVRDDPTTLLVAQGVLFALSVPLVWLAVRRLLGPRAASPVAAAYAVGWPLQGALVADVHEVAFAVPLTALALERWSAGRVGQAALAAASLVLVKEDLGLVAAAFGVVLAVHGARRLGLALGVTGVLASWVAVTVIVPAAGGRSGYHWRYDHLGESPAEAAGFVLRQPLEVARLAVTPDTKALLLLALLGPVLFACLASAWSLLAVPLLAERLLSSNPDHWIWGHHYDAFVWPVLVVAAAHGARRLPRRWREPWAGAALCAAVVLLAVGPVGALRGLADPDTWERSPRERAAAAAVAAVPDGVLVEADNNLGPHLTARTRVLLFDAVPRGAAWVVADTARVSFPFASVEEQRARVAALRTAGYRPVLQREGYVVLHRDGGR